MDPPFSGFVFDPSKCCDMSPGEKRELFLKLAKRPEKSLEMLCRWSRRDLLEILCLEVGKERKFTGLPKQKLIECLLQIESEKKSQELIQDKSSSRAPPPKRPRKSDCPSRLPVETSYALLKSSEENEALDVTCYCVNSEAQRHCAQAVAALDSFQEFQTPRAGLMSSGIVTVEDVSPTSLALILEPQGNLLSSEEPVGYALWHRKADEDYPIEPKFRILEVQRIRFLVTDLAQGTDYVFKLIASCNAGELGKWEVRARTNHASKADDSSSNSHSTSPKQHERSCDISSGLSNSPSEGYESNNAVTFQDLNKSPDICCGEKSDILGLGKSPDDRGALSISTLVEEPNSTIQTSCRGESTTNSAEQNEVAVVPVPVNELAAPLHNQMEASGRFGTRREASSRITYAKPSVLHDNGHKRSERELLTGSLTKKEAAIADGSLGREEFQCCVKAIRRLECEGHIEANFRLKFLTWFGLHATPQERRIVTVFVDTMIGDPKSLTGQLVDTFSEALRRKRRPPPSSAGLCSRIWH